jgi:hypothetical protein
LGLIFSPFSTIGKFDVGDCPPREKILPKKIASVPRCVKFLSATGFPVSADFPVCEPVREAPLHIKAQV